VTGRTGARIAVAVVLGLLAGCAGSPGPAAERPAASPAAAPAPAPDAALGRRSGGADAACADYDLAVDTVRGIADALRRGPVLPAGAAMFLTGPRARAAASSTTDPALSAAGTELVAAIDDLEAQGQALLPPGGNLTRDPVQLDPTRILAAATRIERLCGRG
jgi:hypothetical protein